MYFVLILFVILFADSVKADTNATLRKFPDGFLFGAATASYQTEGGWDADDKGENIWDYLTHNQPHIIRDKSSGDEACDSYHLYKRDVEMLKELGVDFYRFSISWSRILPTGFTDKISKDGIKFYNNLINELIQNGILPYATIYHWDLPQKLQELGGWANPQIIDAYVNYAEVLFKAFGDRVKLWLTFNEHKEICVGGYGGSFAPALNNSGIGDYLCNHNVIKSHAKAYHLYDEKYRTLQNGRISMTLSTSCNEPATNKTEDVEAAERARLFETALFGDPIFAPSGDYPKEIKERISQRSKEQGYASSRLPSFTPDEVEYIRGTYDFIGLNHYTTHLIKKAEAIMFSVPSYLDDRNVNRYQDASWESGISSWLKVVPWGIRKVLNWLKDRYNNPDIIIFENGFSDSGRLNDSDRVQYYRSYLEAVQEAIFDDDCNVTGYTAWSLMDNFEWFQGYTEHFGIYHVDFKSANKTRTPKGSAVMYKELLRTKVIDWSFDPGVEDGSGALVSSMIVISLEVIILFIMS